MASSENYRKFPKARTEAFSRNGHFRDDIRAHFFGNGLDLGPWHMPFNVPNGKTALVDRYTNQEMLDIFPEFDSMSLDDLHNADFTVDFDLDCLDIFESNSMDYVIASHLLEHLAQPFLFFAEIIRVLRPGGKVLIALPDRRSTWDENRKIQSFDHYLNDHEHPRTRPDLSHLADYLFHVLEVPFEDITEEMVKREISRSFHVHVFEDHQFVGLLESMCRHLNLKVDVVTGAPTKYRGRQYEEFILILEKTDKIPFKYAFRIKFFLIKFKRSYLGLALVYLRHIRRH